MEIRTKDETFVLIFYDNPAVTINHGDYTVEVEVRSKDELIRVREKINEILADLEQVE